MATTRTTSKKKIIDDNYIIAAYMADVLAQDQKPKNIYLFCKNNGIEEADFYTYFASLKHIGQKIWVKFFENAKEAMLKDESYQTYNDKNKLLTLYYTLFEILTLNRTYVMYSLEGHDSKFKNIKDLKLLRDEFKTFIGDMISDNSTPVQSKLHKITRPVFSEGAWIQFLLLLKYWMEDTSKKFEKTDILIEKSVNTAVDLLDTKPLESLIDLGKFLWKERTM